MAHQREGRRGGKDRPLFRRQELDDGKEGELDGLAGRIIQVWSLEDTLGRLRQLGLA